MKNYTKTKAIKEDREVMVQLTDDEQLARAREAAKEARAKSLTEDELAGVKLQFKGRLEEHTVKIQSLTQAVYSRQEPRKVECERMLDFERGEVIVRRLDTLEVLETRRMNREEAQMEFDMDSED